MRDDGSPSAPPSPVDLDLLGGPGGKVIVVPGRGVRRASRRLRRAGLVVSVYGLHPSRPPHRIAVDLAGSGPTRWFLASLLEPSSPRGLLHQRLALLACRLPVRPLLFATCGVVGRAP